MAGGVITLVTGASGFLGSHVTDLLVGRGERPRLLIAPDEPVQPLPVGEVDLRRGDICDAGDVRDAVRGVDCILHCAAKTGPWGPQAEYERTNVRALESLVRLAADAGARRFVHVSSVTVHGNDVGGRADEETPFREEPNPYSRSKLAAERVLIRLSAEQVLPITIVRPGWIYGPRDRASFARLARKLEAGQMVIIGPGTNHLPLVYVRDAARGVLLASQGPRASGRAYALVNDEPITQLDYLSAIARELGTTVPSRRLPYRLALSLGAVAEAAGRLTGRRQPPSVMRYGVQMLGGENRFSIDRAREELGFTPSVSMLDGVGRSIRWYRTLPEHATRQVAA
jgi:nucleoside-diphosphate-sugar epimerase